MRIDPNRLLPALWLLFALVAVGASSARADGSDPCSGIQYHYFERIEAQGFLGLGTPSAKWSTVSDALARNVRQASYKNRAVHEFWGWPQYQQNVPWQDRERNWFRVLGFEFRQDDVCTLLKKRGITQLTFACVSDTADYGKQNPDPKVDDPTILVSECFLSTYPGRASSIKDLRRFQLGRGATEKDSAEAPQESTAIDIPACRTDEYYDLIRLAVNGVALDYRAELPPPAPPKVADHCPVKDGMPLVLKDHGLDPDQGLAFNHDSN